MFHIHRSFRVSLLNALFVVAACCGAIPAYAASQIDIHGPATSALFGTTVTVLPNGNFVIIDPNFSIPAGASAVGAVYLCSGTTLAQISTLTGSSPNDQVGNTGIVVLSNGNFVVVSPNWTNGSNANAGAVTWVNGTTGLNGTVSPTNSLIGGAANDYVGGFTSDFLNGVTALPNGNYVVNSTNWINGTTTNCGAVTWCNGNGSTVGAVSATNSLVGGTTQDQVGLDSNSYGITILTNGNYVVSSYLWNTSGEASTQVGAATWCSGTSASPVGLITASNSLVGGTSNDEIGYQGITALTNGNYVVNSPIWINPSGLVSNAGAVTWGNGIGGTVGTVSSGNSLIGVTSGDEIGSDGVLALTNGNYVVGSSLFNNGTPSSDVGAATWCNGSGGTVGPVTSSNSLIGGTSNDAVGYSLLGLKNGNYVVASSTWTNPVGPISTVGAVTWGNGNGGTVGLITASNSLVGGTANDQIGVGGVYALTDGNYVVSSTSWSNPTGSVSNAGAATWGNGAGGTVGLVSAANSLVGGTSGDSVGQYVTPLTNGNYVVASNLWTNPAGPISSVGAATWCNGAGGTVGLLSAGNSLVGGTASDLVGVGGVMALTNGNYVVVSQNWTNPTGGLAYAGAVTWGNGTGGTVGLVSASNSLVGGLASDQIGDSGIRALTNGNYVVSSGSWNNPTGSVTNAGAVTFGKGTGGTVGIVSSSNSLVGGTQNDDVGVNYGGVSIVDLGNGNYVVLSSQWTNPAGPISGAGAYSFGDAFGNTTGLITSTNSVLGTISSGVNTFAYDPARNHFYVGRAQSNIVTVFTPTLYSDHFAVAAPATAMPGTSIQVTVTAENATNTTQTGYSGTVHFSSSDAAAVLPADYTFVATDMGVHTFSVTLNTQGMQTVTAIDTVAPSAGTSAGTAVSLPGAPPVIASLTSSQNPSLLNQSVTFTFVVTDSSVSTLPYMLNFGDGSPVSSGTFTQGTPFSVSHVYSAYADAGVMVTLTIPNGATPVTQSLVQFIPSPASGAPNVPNISQGAAPITVPPTTPLGGISVEVDSSNGGVIELGIDVSSLTRASYDVSTLFGDVQGRSSATSGTSPVHQYTSHGIYVAHTTATNTSTSKLAGEARLTLAVSTAETGETTTGEHPARKVRFPDAASSSIAASSLKGKFAFAGTTPDIVSLTGSITLDAGFDTTKSHEVFLGIGNIVIQTTVNTKGVGAVPGSVVNSNTVAALKSLKLTTKLKKGSVSKGGESATITASYSMANMVANGFDTEGISNQSTDVGKKQSASRTIQVAMLIDGVPYVSLVPVAFSLSGGTSFGNISGRSSK